MLHENIKTIINDTLPEVPQKIKDSLYDQIMREVRRAALPNGRKEGVTVMTEAASKTADSHRRGERKSKEDPKPRTL